MGTRTPRRLGAKHPRTARWGFALCGILLTVVSTPLRAEWLFDADASLFHDGNLSRASAAADVRADSAATLAIAGRWFAAPTAYDGFTVGGAVGGEAYHRYHGLNNAWALGTARYRHKFGVGLEASWFLGEVAGGYYGYDVDVRTGARYALRLEVGRRLGESLDTEIGAFYDRRYGPFGEPDIPGISGKVFNLSGRGMYVRAAYAMTENLLLSARLAVRRGDVVSTLSETEAIISAATAIAEDPTFGDELYDYRLRGTTRTAVVTISWALNDRASLNLTYTGEATNATAGFDYRSNAANLTLSCRY